MIEILPPSLRVVSRGTRRPSPPIWHRWRHGTRAFGSLVICLAATAACSILPTTTETADSPWESFDEAKAAYDSIVPRQTTKAELTGLGYDPLETPNVRVLSYIDLIQRFLPREAIAPESLDPDLRACIEAREDCWGYEVAPSVIDRQREGNVALDIFGFRRETVTTGWRFSAVVVLMEDLVVYKIWDGTPKIREQKVETKPLGPLQELDKIIQPRAIPIP